MNVLKKWPMIGIRSLAKIEARILTFVLVEYALWAILCLKYCIAGINNLIDYNLESSIMILMTQLNWSSYRLNIALFIE